MLLLVLIEAAELHRKLPLQTEQHKVGGLLMRMLALMEEVTPMLVCLGVLIVSTQIAFKTEDLLQVLIIVQIE